ncbi:MAG: DUF2268 domain-containing putative Zn-dependent protease [bacterium]|nr:DUF2268 domain-containing putative Zn-dependent protease [bacterium]
MKIIDLTENYRIAVLEHDSLVEYETTFPELFDHYFQYWADRKRFFRALDNKELQERLNLFYARLPRIEKWFNDSALPVEKLQLVLFVGQDCTNGHAFKHKDEFLVWIPVEVYRTAMQVDVFVTHEIIHGLHYSRVSEFYFKTASEKYSMARQFLTEGLATYLTLKIVNVNEDVALCADYLSTDKRLEWMGKCKSNKEGLFKFVLENFYSENRDFFEANDPDNIYKNRAGYYVGLEVIKKIAEARHLTNHELLNLPRKKFEEFVLSSLNI